MSQDRKEIIIYTDGAARGNPGPGGYGLVLIDMHADEIVEKGEGYEHTTNNAMELLAVLRTLEIIFFKKDRDRTYTQIPVHLYTDSRYVHQGITSWMHGWARNGWRKKDGEIIGNKELWQKVHTLAQDLADVPITYVHVPGHAGIPGNERADTIATAYADIDDNFSPYRGSSSEYTDYALLIQPPREEELTVMRASKKEQKKKTTGRPLGYLSYVEGSVYFDTTWNECKERVHGKKGVSFRKVMTESDIRDLLNTWGVPKNTEVIGYEI